MVPCQSKHVTIVRHLIHNCHFLGLTRVQLFDLERTWPRHFLIHPEGRHLLVAEQFWNQIEVVNLDPSNGLLTKGMTIDTEAAPTVLAFGP